MEGKLHILIYYHAQFGNFSFSKLYSDQLFVTEMALAKH